MVRVHSGYLTGDVFGSERCECGPLKCPGKNTQEPGGGLLRCRRRPRGRGIGTVGEAAAYLLQDAGETPTRRPFARPARRFATSPTRVLYSPFRRRPSGEAAYQQLEEVRDLAKWVSPHHADVRVPATIACDAVRPAFISSSSSTSRTSPNRFAFATEDSPPVPSARRRSIWRLPHGSPRW
jgi:hypothetical protein